MDLTIQWVTALSMAVSAVALLGIFAEVRHIRTRGLVVTAMIVPPSTHSHNPRPSGGYAIFVYNGGRWQLTQDFSMPGYAPVPPQSSGAFENQAIKTESIQRPGSA